MKDLKTAILIFAQSAEEEAKKKPFRNSKAVFESLNLHTLNTVRKSEIPYFLINETQQIGANFAEKYTNAIQSIYNLGYESLIIIGNDTPHLTTKQLKISAEKLAKRQTVIGTCIDGGYYLLGIRKEYFNLQSFLNLPWQTRNLSAATKQLFKECNSPIFSLKKLIDIDNFQDIEKILDLFNHVYQFLFRLLLQITFIKKIYFVEFSEIIPSLLLSNSHNKGSPIFI